MTSPTPTVPNCENLQPDGAGVNDMQWQSVDSGSLTGGDYRVEEAIQLV